jgi:hypothetical protein
MRALFFQLAVLSSTQTVSSNAARIVCCSDKSAHSHQAIGHRADRLVVARRRLEKGLAAVRSSAKNALAKVCSERIAAKYRLGRMVSGYGQVWKDCGRLHNRNFDLCAVSQA